MKEKEMYIEKARQVGDTRQNKKGQTEVWTEYKPGKFDWRPSKKTAQPDSSSGGKQPSEEGEKKTDAAKKNLTDYSPAELVKFAQGATTAALEGVVNDKNQHKDVRQIAFNVLKKRNDYNKDKVDSSDLDGGDKKYSYAKKKPEVDINSKNWDFRDASGKSDKKKREKYVTLFADMDEAKLLQILNNNKMSAQVRHLAYEEADKRGIPEDKIDVSGTLKDLWDNEKKKWDLAHPDESFDDDDFAVTVVDNGLGDFDAEDFMSQFPDGDSGWANPDDDRVKKAFGGLKTMKDRQLYDNFLDYQKRQNPNYVAAKIQLGRMKKGYIGFLQPTNNRAMMVVAGGAGVGKTYGLKQTFAAMQKRIYDPEKYNAQYPDDYDVIFAPQINSLPKLAKFLSDNSDKIVVFDDNDNILTNQDISNVMKTLGDTDATQRFFPEYDEKGKATGKNARFTGKMIILTNKDSATLNRNEDAKAVMSRASKQEINFTVQENLDILKDRYKKMDTGIEIPGMPADEEEQLRQDIYDYIIENKDKLDPQKFTVRKYIDIYEKAANEYISSQLSDDDSDLEAEDWRVSALEILNKGENYDILENNLAFKDPEEDWDEDTKKFYQKIKNKLEDGNDAFIDEYDDKTDKKDAKIKKSIFDDFGMSLRDAENILLN